MSIFHGHDTRRGLHSFPTRRSSDLEAGRPRFPVLLKAAAGGGGKGMRLVREEGELASAFEAAQSEALKAFGAGEVYVEKRSEEHTSELQSHSDLVCRLLLEKKNAEA